MTWRQLAEACFLVAVGYYNFYQAGVRHGRRKQLQECTDDLIKMHARVEGFLAILRGEKPPKKPLVQ